MSETQADRLALVEDHHFWFLGRDRMVDNLIERFGALDPILDLGCGTGAYAESLRRKGRNVVAFDREPTPGRIPFGRVVVGDAEMMGFASDSVETVLARDVLEHVDDVATLRECARVLRPGGLLVALVPAWPFLWGPRDERAHHLRRYRHAGLRHVIEQAGLRIRETRGYQFSLLPVAIASRLTFRGARQLGREDAPPAGVNRLFTAVNRFEADLARSPRWRPPTGTTLVVVAEKA